MVLPNTFSADMRLLPGLPYVHLQLFLMSFVMSLNWMEVTGGLGWKGQDSDTGKQGLCPVPRLVLDLGY